MNVSQSLLAAAFGGMVLGSATACGGGSQAQPEPSMQGSQGASSMPMAMDGGGAKHACKGMNDCKGKGGCKTDKHACKGMNDCKGQGGCKM